MDDDETDRLMVELLSRFVKAAEGFVKAISPLKVHVHLYVNGPVTVDLVTQPPAPPAGKPTSQSIRIGDGMTGPTAAPTAITVDVQNETVAIATADQFGNPDTPAGASGSFTDSAGIVTFAPDPDGDPLTNKIVPTGVVGTAQITGDTLDSTGVSLGLPAPAAVALEVDPGAPVGERLTLASEQPVGPTGPYGPSGPSGPTSPSYFLVTGTPDPVVWIPSGQNDGSTPPNELYTLAPGQANDGTGSAFTGVPEPDAPAGPTGPFGGAGPTQAVYQFIGADPTTIDGTAWTVAPWDDASGDELYYFTGADATTIDPTQWVEYTGTAVPVVAGA
jgi:hypothetical protein